MGSDTTTLTLAPPRPASSKVWVAYRTRQDGLRLVRDEIFDWDELSHVEVSARGKGPAQVRIGWSAWLKRLPKELNAKPSQLFSTKDALLAHLSKHRSGPSFGPYSGSDEEDPFDPPMPVGSKAWTWFANGFNEEDICGRIGEATISEWLAKAPRRLTKSSAGQLDWRAWVGDANGFSHPPEWLFPTKEALLDYLDRTATDLTK